MRADGRAADELRPVAIIPDFTQNPAGSVLIRTGQTAASSSMCGAISAAPSAQLKPTLSRSGQCATEIMKASTF